MRVLVINPNSTASMTDGIAAAARAAAAPDMEIEGLTNAMAPPAIQGEADGRAAAPGVVAACAEAGPDIDAAIIACFDDTGLAEARAIAPVPVLGIGQAAFLAAMVYGRFSVITTLPVSVPVIEANIASYGLAEACAGVHPSELPVLSLEADPATAEGRLTDCARKVAETENSQALVLGCAGMASFGPAMQRASGLPAIDGVAAAIGLARTVLMAGGDR
ncbi:MAG: aspartate/glutamate racemase family protein [Pseudomonadota bacterium]